MAVAELSRVNSWIMDVLSGDGSLQAMVQGRVYVDQAPEHATTPLVIFAFLGGSDKVLTSTGRLTQVLYLIRAVAENGTYDDVAPLADRIEAALTLPEQGTVVDQVRITTVFREQPHQRMDSQYGVRTVYMGGFYRIRFQPANQ